MPVNKLGGKKAGVDLNREYHFRHAFGNLIPAETYAHRLISQARRLYANENLGLDLTNTVYALDSMTIDLCLSVFSWAPFRSTKVAVKIHTLLVLRGVA